MTNVPAINNGELMGCQEITAERDKRLARGHNEAFAQVSEKVFA